ncbi:MAG TPA: TIGR03984 family CRISPR-associated protein [Cyanobacteria bacterium UBA11149]|nr:TIGR03984 family CRISPR-associated protein [Cyanobacteria bacterium UBA11367]HBE58552.1 TIGR03984 family CRISPR-associated protein [Cyanobacteria bacterium UBA11366]HBK64777.1 TIGR03984 family CRISPR-associated protein [Cyanobacteria bacterium UBA11166]HBR76512.1 TIGR03984 family CRISPR-associated protein [Cyanobacteria bacterium UBA11159]HBS67882.1 TIGR03984 family CRISPR-associated protein [Cyanobacteria bacterium UBA11153]HBW90079.1 TIGR03984 family CRISPR-associated protein [Cyanobacter
MNKPVCKSLSVEDVADRTPKLWLNKQAKEHGLKYLLAHAEDGVIWGHFKDGELVTSGDVFSQCAKLRSHTLQQCRIFGENSEVMLWKVGQNWKARSIEDGHLSKDDYIPEDQILWGTQSEGQPKQDFTLVSDGSQGLKHAVPLTGMTFKGKDSRPLRLQVRHYIDYDESGVARIYLSRLVNLDFD